MRKIVSCMLVLVLLASALPLAIMPVAAYEKKIPGDADENDELTKDEFVNAILPYMLEEGDLKLDDVGDAAYIYAYWDGEPKTIVDHADRAVTFYRPIERIVPSSPDITRIIIALGACDKLVSRTLCGESNCICYPGSGSISAYYAETRKCTAEVCGGRFYELPAAGTMWSMTPTNEEFMMTLRPDVFFGRSTYADTLQEKTGIPVVVLTSSGYSRPIGEKMYKAIEGTGLILDRENEAEELISFMEEKIDKLECVTSQIPEEEKPRVYLASRGIAAPGASYIGKITKTTGNYYPLDIAGGINVAEGLVGSEVSKEQIIAWEPDTIIIVLAWDSDLAAFNPIETVLSDPDFEYTPAVVNENVYYSLYPYCCGSPQDRNLVNAFYLAKLFHPDKFPDLDVEEEGNEIYERFLGVDGLFSELADYTVWMREWLDSQK